MSIRSITLALAAATAAFAMPAVTVAAEQETATTRVEYKDLDLTSASGQKELDQRLDRAARQVCGMDKTSVGSRISTRQSRDCYRDARRQLDQQFSQLGKGEAAGG